MCNQAVSLVAAECERRGIATVALQLLRLVAEAVRPPRALWLPFPFGYPLGAPRNPEVQRRVLLQALGLVGESGPPPILRDFVEA